MFVHGLNAHGMQHFRRWTANNVDLNRNGAAPDESPLYCAASPFLNVDEPESALSFYAKALYYVARYGFSALKQAVAGGQISTPGGLFFAGTSREPCLSAVLGWLEARFPVVDVHIDLHTGLGPRGRDTIIVDDADRVAPMVDDTCVVGSRPDSLQDARHVHPAHKAAPCRPRARVRDGRASRGPPRA